MQTHTLGTSERRSRWEWWCFCLFCLLAFAFGIVGFRRQEGPQNFSLSAALYQTLQMFVLHSPYMEEGHTNNYLVAAHWLAAAAFLLAAAKAFLTVFRGELMRLSLGWQSNHIVICGLGALGLRLALDGRRRGRFVVAIEKNGEPGAIEEARRNGVLVIEGDGCDPTTLRKLGVERAEFVVAACQEDPTNIAVAAIVGQVLPVTLRRDKPLVCRLLIQDERLSRLIADESLFPTRNNNRGSWNLANVYRINFGDLQLHDTAARQCFRLHPLDFQPLRKDDDTSAHLAVIGFGAMGQGLALHAARIGHFANEVTRGQRLAITVLDRNAKAALDAFKTRYPKIDRVCEIGCREVEPLASDFLDVLEAFTHAVVAQKEKLLTCAACYETEEKADDRENFRIGIELSRRTKGRQVQTLIYQSTRQGYASLFPHEARGEGISPRLHAFGMWEDIFTWDILLHESEDQLARALHEDYQKHHRDQGHKEWESLDDEFRESNRHAADHIPVKLRALGYHDAPLQPGKQRIEKFTDDEIPLLAKMEHARWCAERWLADWEYGPETIREKKINKNLLPWDKLSPEEQKKDPEQISAIARALHEVNRGIYR